MEKYAKLLKGLEMCARPECCMDGCPYYGETRGGTTCRARLLKDASIAIMNERSSAVAALQDREAVEKENDVLRERCREKDKLCQEREELKEYALALEKEGQEARTERDKLAADNKAVREAYKEIDIELHHAQQREKELLKDKTDQPSAISDDLAKQIGELVAHANYQQGRADALAAIVERCSFGGGCRHE